MSGIDEKRPLTETGGREALERLDKLDLEAEVHNAIWRGRLHGLIEIVCEAAQLYPNTDPGQAPHPGVQAAILAYHDWKRIQGGTMGTDALEAPSASPRLSTLEREWATYQSRKSELLEHHAGEHALIHGEEILGFFPSREDALKAAYKQVGFVPFLVHEILAVEPTLSLPPNAL
ncbi:MAG: hypothetical protein WKF75_12820 [Singulisphaera sp.]